MNLNKNSIKKLVLIFLICAADILWSAGFIYLWKTKGVVLSVKEASVNIPGIFVQNLDRKSTRLNSSHSDRSRRPSSA